MSCSIGSYNILNPLHAVKWGVVEGLNDEGLSTPIENLPNSVNSGLWETYSNWNDRVCHISENLKKTDIVCLQEVTTTTLNKLLEITENYLLANAAFQSSSRSSNRSSDFFGNAILYNSNKVEFNESFTVDHRVGSTTRRAACGIFNVGGKTLQIASIHLTGYHSSESDFEKKQNAKKSGFKELKAYVKGIEEKIDYESLDALVIGGDFNEDPNESKFDFYRPEFLTNKEYQFDGNSEPTEPSKKRKIDWIFAKPIVGDFTLHSMNLEKKQIQASDHLMTGTVVEWQR